MTARKPYRVYIRDMVAVYYPARERAEKIFKGLFEEGAPRDKERSFSLITQRILKYVKQ